LAGGKRGRGGPQPLDYSLEERDDELDRIEKGEWKRGHGGPPPQRIMGKKNTGGKNGGLLEGINCRQREKR